MPQWSNSVPLITSFLKTKQILQVFNALFITCCSMLGLHMLEWGERPSTLGLTGLSFSAPHDITKSSVKAFDTLCYVLFLQSCAVYISWKSRNWNINRPIRWSWCIEKTVGPMRLWCSIFSHFQDRIFPLFDECKFSFLFFFFNLNFFWTLICSSSLLLSRNSQFSL